MSWKRFIFASDVHGDQQDKSVNDSLFKFLKVWKPEYRVMGGDLWDFRPLRRKANEEEKRESLVTDFHEGMEWLEKFRPTHFLRGNHDERLWDLAQEDRGVITDFAKQGVSEIEEKLKKLRCQLFPYDKRHGIVRLGHLKIIHGFVSGVNAARRSAQAYGSVLMGHGHGIQHVSIEGIENRMGRMCGCLCKLDMEYNRHLIGSLVHRHGWAYGVIADNGEYQVTQAEQINGKWIIPSNFIEL